MTVTYGDGYQPALLGWCIEQHGRYYCQEWGFGLFFETKVAMDMAGFLRRLSSPRSHLLWARNDDQFLATLALDPGSAESGLLHLRWFITADGARGKGIGHHLMNTAISHATEEGAKGLFLNTFEGLDAAQQLYEKFGFRLINQHHDTTWGVEVKEQRFELRF
ncbi:MAG: GNAT family N-acetyltransferase [Pseudomonadota bacterium]